MSDPHIPDEAVEIVAAELERFAESIDYARYRSRTETGLVTSVDLVREDLLARAAELRAGAL